MADDGYTTILRTIDHAQGEMVAEMLRREGIDARFHQVRSALIGMPAFLNEMTVDVPTEKEALARELLADLEYVGAVEALKEEGEGRRADADQGEDGEPAQAAGEAAPGPLHSRRHPLFAAGFACFLPGGGHLYARRPWTALVLAIGGAGCLLLAIAGGRSDARVFLTALGAIVVCDAVGGVLAARAEQKGKHPSRGRQLARGGCLLCLAVALGIAPPLASAARARRSAARFAELEVSCTTGSIRIANRGTTSHMVYVWNLRVTASSSSGTEQYEIGPSEGQRLVIAPGASDAVTPWVGDLLARSCHFSVRPDDTKADEPFGHAPPETQLLSPRPQYCGYAFSFVENAAQGSNDDALNGSGWCVPSTPSHPETAGRLELAR